MLRASIDEDRELLAVAYSDSTRNINAFTDVSLRRWFAQQNINIDSEIQSSNSNSLLRSSAPLSQLGIRLPTSAEYDEAVASILLPIQLVLEAFGITGEGLISGQYVQDDTGIDAFLNRNTVVIESDEITYQITDPDTNIQSETRSVVQLSDSSVDDGTSPTTPGSVRAINAGMGEIVLTWEPSEDDVGVLGYVVSRDGDNIVTTPFPQFRDTNLALEQTFSYVIRAIDTAGNLSSASSEIVGSTQVAVTSLNSETETPSNLSIISASEFIVRLNWTQPNDANVVSYNVFRGIGLSDLTLLQTVALTRTVDATLTGNQSYCYQVSALSASSEESARSEIVCTGMIDDDDASISEPTDEGIITDSPNPVAPTQVPDSISNENLPSAEEWIIPERGFGFDCPNTLTSDDVATGMLTLSAACYTVPQTVTIAAGATLQIEPGAILLFGEGTRLIVQGTLTAVASRENPILFTGESDFPGSWAGIEFLFSDSPNNIIRGAVIEYAGQFGVLGAVGARGPNSRLSIDDTLIQFSEQFAFSFFNETQIDSFAGNFIHLNGAIGEVNATSIEGFDDTNQYFNNPGNQNPITLVGSTFTGEDIVIPDANVPIRIDGIEITEGSFTVMPGAEIVFGSAARIEVDGPVMINGEIDDPIIFGTLGTITITRWDGLLLKGAGSKSIEHTIINGGGASGTDTGAVHIDCTGDAFFEVDVAETAISNSLGFGIFAEGDNCSINIDESVTYINNAFGDTNVP